MHSSGHVHSKLQLQLSVCFVRDVSVYVMSVSVIIKWGGQEYSISSLSEEDTVMDLKQSIKSLTGVLPERQKLLGLKVKGERASVIECRVYPLEITRQIT